MTIDKKSLSERDICTKFIPPALRKAGWDEMAQIREEVSFTKGRIIVRGKLVSRGKGKRADYILYYKPNIPIALIEAKDNTHATGDGMQQGLDYAETLRIPFVFSSNGDGFVFHDRTGAATERETTLGLDAFPPPGELWERYRAWKGLTPESESIVLQDYFDDDGGKAPRYYQVNAINATIEAIAKGRDLDSGISLSPNGHPAPGNYFEGGSFDFLEFVTIHASTSRKKIFWPNVVSERYFFGFTSKHCRRISSTRLFAKLNTLPG